MSGRRPLKGGAVRLLGTHAGVEGAIFRRIYDALAADLGPLSPLGALEASRVAANWVQLQAATRALAAARRKRVEGRGRRPNVRAIERLARRQGLADASYAASLARLLALAAHRAEVNGHTPRFPGLAEDRI